MKQFHSITAILFIVLLAACSNNKNHQALVTKHYPDSLFIIEIAKAKAGLDRKNSIKYIDSVYQTLPYISVADKYQYYNFRVNLLQLFTPREYSDDSTIGYVDSMMAIIEEAHLTDTLFPEYLSAYLMKAAFFMDKNKFSSAIDFLVQCKLLAEQHGDFCSLTEINGRLGYIYFGQRKFSEAIGSFKSAIAGRNYCEFNSDNYTVTAGWMDALGLSYRESRDLDSALKYHFQEEAYLLTNLEKFPERKNHSWQMLENMYGNIGIVYYWKKDFTNAQTFMRIAIGINNSYTMDTASNVLNRIFLGQILVDAGNIKDAKIMAAKAEEGANKMAGANKIAWLNLKLGIARATKNYKDWSYSSDQRYAIRDSLNKETLENLQKNPAVEYDNLDKKYKLQLLEKEKKIQQNKIKGYVIIGILLLLLIGVILFSLLRIRSIMKKRAVVYKQLIKQEEELRQAFSTIELQEKQKREEELYFQEIRLQIQHNEAIMNQRQKISEDLHDDLSSSLVALGFYVEDMKQRTDDESLKNNLKDIGEEVKSIYHNARNYMHSLKASGMMSKYDLPLLLEEMKTKFHEKTSITFELDIDKKKIIKSLSIQQNDQLYHIINEAITNIIKHSGATRIGISIGFNDNLCKFSIDDNGKGFKSDGSQKGLGLKSMQNRIKNLEGTLDIITSVNGTCIKGVFPIS